MSKKLPTSRRTFVKGTAASAAIAPFFIGRSAKASESIVVKVATVAPRDTIWGKLAKKLAKHGEKQSGGILDFKVYFGGGLGPEKSTAEGCRAARYQMWAGSCGGLAGIVPELSAFELPYLTKGPKDAQRRLLANRQLVHDILWDKGFKLIMFSENGLQGTGTNRPVESPADMKGLKIRTLESKVHMDWIAAQGGQPLPMGVTEVLPSLQTGVIDGFTNTPLFATAAGWLSGISHWTTTEHCHQPAVVVAARKFYESLTPELQEAIGIGSEELLKIEDRGFRQLNASRQQFVQNIVDLGVELHKPDLSPWKKLAKGVHEKFRKRTTKQGVALLKGIQEA